MAVQIIMPRPGQSVESCIITEWKKHVGDKVSAGDILFTFETDKAAFEEEAKEAGTLLAIYYPEYEDVPCLDVVAVIGEEGEVVPDTVDTKGAADVAEPPTAAAEEPAAPVVYADAIADICENKQDKITGVSPRARNLAEKMKLDISKASATGPNGRIIERDIRALAGGRIAAAADDKDITETASVIPEAEYVDIPLTPIRKTIAAAMQASLSTTAQLTHSRSFDASAILAYRKNLKQVEKALGISITINDIINYAVVRVLMEHKYINAHFLDNKIREFSGVNLGFAVDTPRGLIVPTIFGAEKMSLIEIAQASRELGAKAKEGSISPDLLRGATFTVSNLGSFGIESFTPIINPPQTGILGVCGISDRVRKVDGEIDVYPAMGLSLTYDHRAIDGAPASRFLQAIANELETLSALK